VDLEVNATIFTVKVDGAAPPVITRSSKLLGVWPFEVGDRVATLRRVRTIDVARNELWVDGVKVPHTDQAVAPKKPAAEARCKAHRGAAPPAVLACGVCSTPLCAACIAVDDVRCLGCFEDAAEKLRKEERAKQLFGLIAAVVLIAAIALFGFAAESRQALKCAIGMTALLIVLLINGAVRGRLEARAVAVPSTPRRTS
jgi:hypothetical protein